MDHGVSEITYPLSFREQEARILGEQLRHRHSVDIVGMKRVGISNFLRFFLYHKEITKTYIDPDQKQLFIPIDLNDLVEREIFPFWTLTLKRIVDAVENIEDNQDLKTKIESLFLGSIQSQDLFLLIDNIRKSLLLLVDAGFLPNLFFLRFDRIKDAITPEFFNNLQGLRDATHQKVAYVFTSYRTLDVLSPHVFTKASLSVFVNTLYIKPAKEEDMRIIYDAYKKRYELNLTEEREKELFRLVNGNVQYLQLALIILHEKREQPIISKEELFTLLSQDERIILQSEELWESLLEPERTVLEKLLQGESITEEEKHNATYLLETGFIQEQDGAFKVFSPLLEKYIIERKSAHIIMDSTVHLSKKEHKLFTLMQETQDICERDRIIEVVWPEYKEFGVSDWAIDRLVARVRSKLKQQGSKYEIKTIRTRGYQLITLS